MKTFLAVILFLALTGVAGACPHGKPELINGMWMSPRGCGEQKDLRDIGISSPSFYVEHTYFDPQYYVIHSTEEFTLDEFIKSGEFCKIYGHQITARARCICVANLYCGICHKWLTKKQVEDVERWGP